MSGAGLFDQLGIATEVTYGTAVTPTTFLPVQSATLDPVITVVDADSFRAGALAAPGSRRVQTVRGATGSISLEPMTQSFGKVLAALAGSSTSAIQGAGPAYLQTHTFVASTVGKSLTVQASRSPRPSGAALPLTMVGAKVTGLELSCEVNGLLTATVNLDGRDLERTTALAAATYATGAVPFTGTQMCVKTGTFGAETELSGVTGVRVNYARNLDTETWYACGNGLKAEPVPSDWPLEIGGSISRDWLDKTAIEDLAIANTSTSLVVEWVGATIATTYKETLRLKLPGVHFEPAAQGLDGRGPNRRDWDFVYRYDGTNSPVIEYVTKDTAI